jgi:hypothetical protein
MSSKQNDKPKPPKRPQGEPWGGWQKPTNGDRWEPKRDKRNG